MAQPRRKCKLANSEYKDTDLRQYKRLIIDTVNETVPGKNPKVYQDYFSTDPLTQSESVALGRALSKIPKLNSLGKTVTTFRLFDGKTYESEASLTPVGSKKNDTEKKNKGGRMK